ncbi:888_t:CDS:2, partial [Paraglomus occultum]
DQNDTIDITDNDIRVLGNFPLLPRLRRLLLANNRITRIDPQLAEYLPNVNTIVLTNNNISELSELEPLGGLKKLQYLSLLDNPVTRKKHYRSYVIWKVPSVRVLDFKRVRKVEREEAQKLFVTADGSESSLAKSISETAAKTFEPGEGIFPSTNKPNVPTHGTTTSEDQNKIREAIKNAKTLDEVARLEKLLQSGQIPLSQNDDGGGGGGGSNEEEEDDEEMDEA